MSSNSVCNHTRDKQIGLPLRGRPICYHSYDYRLNWPPLSPITITKYIHKTKKISRGAIMNVYKLIPLGILRNNWSAHVFFVKRGFVSLFSPQEEYKES